MGHCGIDQPGAPYKRTMLSAKLERDNHIMCATFYINAFENKFSAVLNGNCGISSRDVSPVPANYYMGICKRTKGW